MEWPELSTIARSTWLMTIPDAILSIEPVAEGKIDRLAVTMVKILEIRSAEVLHDNIVSTFLPNLVDAANPSSRKSKQVFANNPHVREKLIDIVKSYEGDSDLKILKAWLMAD